MVKLSDKLDPSDCHLARVKISPVLRDIVSTLDRDFGSGDPDEVSGEVRAKELAQFHRLAAAILGEIVAEWAEMVGADILSDYEEE
jgi:hypothetical protein